MPKFFVREDQIKQNEIRICGEDVNHIKNVLRAKLGEKIEICDKVNACNYQCEIQEMKQEEIICRILEKTEDQIESNIHITIFQGLPKSDKMELIIQKAVELGVYDIVPVEMKRCVVKLDEKDKKKKIQRWQKIAEVAAKQCGRNLIPEIHEVLTLKAICQQVQQYDMVLLAYEKEEELTLKQVLREVKKNTIGKAIVKLGIIIGPEGGFAEEEVGFLQNTSLVKVLTLGKRILRTETVAFHMLSILMYELEEGEGK